MNVIITGGNRGIGFELSKLFAKGGHNVFVLSRNVTGFDTHFSENITRIPFDITSEEDIKAFKDHIERLPNLRFDALIHNAGLLIKKDFKETTTSDFETVYKTNVFGVASLTRAIIPYINSGGHVLGISSIGGVQGSKKFPELSAYSSSKAALIVLMEVLAETYKDSNIAFNTLALGAVQTAMLEKAFPNYKALIDASQMASYIYEFSVNGYKFYNGKTLQVAVSTP